MERTEILAVRAQIAAIERLLLVTVETMAHGAAVKRRFLEEVEKFEGLNEGSTLVPSTEEDRAELTRLIKERLASLAERMRA